MFIFYIVFTNKSDSILSWIFLPSALLSTSFMLNFIVYILLLILSLILRKAKIISAVSVLAYSVFFIFIIVDLFIFRLYNFHFNGMVVNMLSTDGFWDSVSLGGGTWFSTFIIVVLVIIFQSFLLFASSKIRFRKSVFTKLLIILLTITVFEKFLYAYADIYNKINITRYTELFPLYQPFTMKGFASKFINVNNEERVNFNAQDSLLNYPKQPIKISKKNKERPNIIIIAIDGWRFDMLNKEVTPNISRFAEKSLVFKNHFSGGNASRFGVFSIFYGVHGYYWHSFLSERQSPVLMDTLQKLNYNFEIISSTRLTFPEFRKTAFVKIPDSIYDTNSGDNAAEKDNSSIRRFIKWHKNYNEENPYFSFIFLDAPHAREFPEHFNKFDVENTDTNYLLVDKKSIAKLKYAYMNAIYYDDYLLGKLLGYLKKSNSLKNTIIIITADHGEEFYEEGNFGHNSAFTEYQLKVPLVMYMPEKGHKEIEYITSHLDIVPTLMKELGVINKPSDYSLGKNMLRKTGRKYIVACTWDSCAIYDRKTSLVFSFETYDSSFAELYNEDYQLVENQKMVNRKSERILPVAKDFAHFFK